jgi:hypothetical protein
LAVSQWLQDALDQEVAPVEEGVMPGDIVGVNHRRGGHEPMKQVCNGGLSASSAGIHSQNPRSAITGSVSIEYQTDDVAGRHHSPWIRWRLPGAELHAHLEIRLLVGLRRGLTHLLGFATANLSF